MFLFSPPMRRPVRAVLAAALVLGWMADAASAATPDEAMLALASQSGCMTCHHVDTGGRGPDGLAPIGPAWRSVAARYRGQADAGKRLTATVMSGSNPYESHWKGQASGLAMPPNRVAISQPDAKRLVDWILALKPAP